MKSGLDAMPLFHLDDLLKYVTTSCHCKINGLNPFFMSSIEYSGPLKKWTYAFTFFPKPIQTIQTGVPLLKKKEKKRKRKKKKKKKKEKIQTFSCKYIPYSRHYNPFLIWNRSQL